MNTKKPPKTFINHQEWLLSHLHNKKNATAYLQAALDEYQHDINAEALLLALRNVAIARGGMKQLAEKIHLNRESLYKALSKKGNPKFETLSKVLDGLGFHLYIKAA